MHAVNSRQTAMRMSSKVSHENHVTILLFPGCLDVINGFVMSSPVYGSIIVQQRVAFAKVTFINLIIIFQSFSDDFKKFINILYHHH